MICNYEKRSQVSSWQREGDEYLIIPAVGASSDLNSIGQAVGTAQEVGTELRNIVRSSVIQADDEQSVVDDLQTRTVVFGTGKILTVM